MLSHLSFAFKLTCQTFTARDSYHSKYPELNCFSAPYPPTESKFSPNYGRKVVHDLNAPYSSNRILDRIETDLVIIYPTIFAQTDAVSGSGKQEHGNSITNLF